MGKSVTAYKLAEKAFQRANDFTNDISDRNFVHLLNKLLHDFVVYKVHSSISDTKENDSDYKFSNQSDDFTQGLDIVAEDASLARAQRLNIDDMFATEKNEGSNETTANIWTALDGSQKESKEAFLTITTIDDDAEEISPKMIYSRSKYRGGALSVDAVSMLIIKLKKYVSLSSPLYLESLPSGVVDILPALERIFRVYVRGYALAGQNVGGGNISLNNRKIPYLSFLLNGPYLSWSGFLCILKDFDICPVSSAVSDHKRSKFISKYIDLRITHIDSSPPLSLKETAALFIESSRTGKPLLTLERYQKEYDEILQDIQIDPWDDVYEWASSDDWDIKTGLNFMQFIDCLGVSPHRYCQGICIIPLPL